MDVLEAEMASLMLKGGMGDITDMQASFKSALLDLKHSLLHQVTKMLGQQDSTKRQDTGLARGSSASGGNLSAPPEPHRRGSHRMIS